MVGRRPFLWLLSTLSPEQLKNLSKSGLISCLGRHASSERILEGQIDGGLVARMNLDGSASWQGRSADELLDEFMRPFQDGSPSEDIVHLLAINDGRLLEWIAGVESRQQRSETPLTKELYDRLDGDVGAKESHIRFINLNQRWSEA